MKSILIENLKHLIKDPENYSDLKVLNSNGAYYIGTTYNNPYNFPEPGLRDSDYFKTKEEAEFFLEEVISGKKEALSKLRTQF